MLSNPDPPTKLKVGARTCGASGSAKASFTCSLNFSEVPRLDNNVYKVEIVN